MISRIKLIKLPDFFFCLQSVLLCRVEAGSSYDPKPAGFLTVNKHFCTVLGDWRRLETTAERSSDFFSTISMYGGSLFLSMTVRCGREREDEQKLMQNLLAKDVALDTLRCYLS